MTAGLAVLALGVFALNFVWSITGTIALRHGLLLWVIVGVLALRPAPAAMLQLLRARAVWAFLLALCAWIVLHNLLLAWAPQRAWYESQQWFKSMLCLLLGAGVMCVPARADGARRALWWLAVLMLAYALYVSLNIAWRPWSQLGALRLSDILRPNIRIGSRDMVSYLATGLSGILMADVVARLTAARALLPVPKALAYAGLGLAVVLTALTFTRNSLLILILQALIAASALLSADCGRRLQRCGLAGLALVLVAGAAFMNVRQDARWQAFAGSARVAWDIDTHRYWLSSSTYPFPTLPGSTQKVDDSGYLRIAWLKGGARMLAQYPLGVGYDRNAFRRALERSYPQEVVSVGHAHAGLLDFALGVGIPGLALLMGSLLAAARFGWLAWRRQSNAAGLALCLFACSYLARAAVDGIVRDHMLEQAMFMLGILLAASVFWAEEKT